MRYLGDLSGGQIIRRRVARAYGLDLGDGDGIQFYDFEDGDVKNIKRWYRAGMNAGTANDQKLKGNSPYLNLKAALSNIIPPYSAAILQEANNAFELNINLYSTLKSPSSPSLPCPSPHLSILGDSELQIELNHFSDEEEAGEPAVETYPPTHRRYALSLGSVFSVLVAVCLAHFVLVTSGFPGTAWLNKFENMGWLTSPAPL